MVNTNLQGAPQMRTRSLLAALIVATTLVLAAGASARPGPPSDVRGAFFANWDRYARGYLVKGAEQDEIVRSPRPGDCIAPTW